MADENGVALKDLSTFVFKRILNANSQRKVIYVEGSLQGGGCSILLLEKKAFTEENVKKLCDENSVLKNEFINDVYGSYECFPVVSLNGIKTTVIHPATKEHIKKFESQPFHIIEETKELFETVTSPYILNQQLSLQWVYNILEHKTEADRIVFEDPHEETGFILLPDLKWDGKQIETLYLLAICNLRGIKSLRDLKSDHLKLLKNILSSGTKVIKDLYNIEQSRLRIFVHYQPSFYHFHVHFTYIGFDAPGITCDRSHLLVTVIDNIELMPNYYQNCTLPFIIKESEGFFQEFVKKGIVKQIDMNKSS